MLVDLLKRKDGETIDRTESDPVDPSNIKANDVLANILIELKRITDIMEKKPNQPLPADPTPAKKDALAARKPPVAEKTPPKPKKQAGTKASSKAPPKKGGKPVKKPSPKKAEQPAPPKPAPKTEPPKKEEGSGSLALIATMFGAITALFQSEGIFNMVRDVFMGVLKGVGIDTQFVTNATAKFDVWYKQIKWFKDNVISPAIYVVGEVFKTSMKGWRLIMDQIRDTIENNVFLRAIFRVKGKKTEIEIKPYARPPQKPRDYAAEVPKAEEIVGEEAKPAGKEVEVPPAIEVPAQAVSVPELIPTPTIALPQAAPVSKPSLAATGQVKEKMPEQSVLDAIEYASTKTGTDVNIMLAMAKQESGFDPNAKAGTSSAKGLYQFIDKTWDSMVKKYSGQYPELLRGPLDPVASAIAGALYIKENAAILQKAGIAINGTNIYAAHFLGPGGAAKLLAAPTNTIAANILPAAASANKYIFYDKKDNHARTTGEVTQVLYKKVGYFAEQYAKANASTMIASAPTTGRQLNYSSAVVNSEKERPRNTTVALNVIDNSTTGSISKTVLPPVRSISPRSLAIA